MRYQIFELNISCICMGCMRFGDAKNGKHRWNVNEEYTCEIIRRGLNARINSFNTAIVYQSGISERHFEKELKDFAKKEDVGAATKFPPRTKDKIAERIYESCVSIFSFYDVLFAVLSCENNLTKPIRMHLWEERFMIYKIIL